MPAEVADLLLVALDAPDHRLEPQLGPERAARFDGPRQ